MQGIIKAWVGSRGDVVGLLSSWSHFGACKPSCNVHVGACHLFCSVHLSLRKALRGIQLGVCKSWCGKHVVSVQFLVQRAHQGLQFLEQSAPGNSLYNCVLQGVHSLVQ